VIDKINDLFEFEIKAFGMTYTVNPPDIKGIPELASGGIARRPTLALIGEAGPEAVIPLSRGAQYGLGGGGGTTNIVINMPPGSNGDDVVLALQNYQRRNGTVPINTRTI
jgi:hypothetical protein